MLAQRVKQFILAHKLIQPHDIIIVGLSGGPDSVFLLHMLKLVQVEFSLTLIVAHLDHEWRENSAQDAQFCRQLAADLGILFVLGKASEITLTKKPTGSQEELGRLLRRQFFAQVMHDYQAHAVALGHHADDQQETFFIRLVRGATLSGLAAMRPRSGCIIRPLLALYKAEILHYLQEQQIAFIHDYTNEQQIFLRNKIRHTVLPALRAADSRFDKNFAKTLAYIQETEQFLEQLTAQEFTALTQQINNKFILDTQKLFSHTHFLQMRLILFWLCTVRVPFSPSTRLLEEILRFLRSEGSGTHTLYARWTITKKQQQAYITYTKPH